MLSIDKMMLLRAVRCRVGWAAMVVCVSLPLITSRASAEEEPKFDEAKIEFFEAKVRPLLVKRCYKCHGPDAKKLEGGLSLATRDAAITGGDTGPAIEPGDAEKSLLIDAINYGEVYEMPPDSKMPDDEIAILTKWVDMGAPWTPGQTSQQSRAKFDLQQRIKNHWVWQPVKEQALPTVRQADWPRDGLDFFILQKLEAANLKPAPTADRHAWIRRVYFDLIGLPPTVAQVEAFVNDGADDAFEKVVDELLRSPHFGERWARHWMDLVRYAETCGHEFDYPIPQAYQYRDYLIRAFNADVPFDLFIKEHIAGDLLPNPRRHPMANYNESLIGTGFWFLDEATHAPVDVRANEAGHIDNRLDVMSKSFLGMTVACARCHDHKFDAITTKDYYGLAGFLQSSRRQLGMLDPQEKIATIANDLRDLRKQGDALLGFADETEQSGSEARSESNNVFRFADYLRAATEIVLADNSIDHVNLQPVTPQAEAAENAVSIKSVAAREKLHEQLLAKWVAALQQPSIREPADPLFVWYETVLRNKRFDAGRLAELRNQVTAQKQNTNAQQDKQNELPFTLEDFDDGRYDGWFLTGEAFQGGLSDMPQWNTLAEGVSTIPGGIAHSGLTSPKLQGVLRSPTFELRSNNIYYRLAGQGVQVRLIIDGFDMFPYNGLLFGGAGFDVNTGGKFIWHQQGGDIGRYKGHRAYIEFIDQGDGWVAIDEIVLSDGGTPQLKDKTASAVLSGESEISSLEQLADRYVSIINDKSAEARPVRTALLAWSATHELISDQPNPKEKLREKIKTRMNELAANLSAPVLVQAITDGTPENEHVFVRGNHKILGDEAPRRLLEALDGAEVLGDEESSGRLKLAERIADPDNPLTSRVIVNRLWHHMTGRGIVASTDNFGVLGHRPTHPELLDYLASEFVKDGWSIKHLLRRIALSSTYRMSSLPADAAAQAADPDNLLLHRMRIRRLQGEAIRDAMLQISGRLDPKMFGPSVPVHLTSFMQGRGRPGGSGSLDSDGRRSIYVEIRRNFLAPMMLAFDTPQPFSSVGRRNVSNVPAQALILMNDPFVVQQAELWAKQLLASDAKSTPDRIQRLYEQAYSRPPSDIELSEATSFIESQQETNKQAADDPRLWAELCHVLLNVKEFIYIK